MSVSERTADGFELATLPAQAGHAVDAPLDAFIDLRDEPVGLAVELDPAPDTHHDRGAGAGRARPHGPLPARRPRRRRDCGRRLLGDRHGRPLRQLAPQVAYVALSLAVPILWVLLVAIKRGYEQRFLGRGPEEYRRLWEAGLLLFITMAVLSFSVKGDVARGYVCLVVPMTLVVGAAHRTVAPALGGTAARPRARRAERARRGPEAEARGLFERLRTGGVPGCGRWASTRTTRTPAASVRARGGGRPARRTWWRSSPTRSCRARRCGSSRGSSRSGASTWWSTQGSWTSPVRASRSIRWPTCHCCTCSARGRRASAWWPRPCSTACWRVLILLVLCPVLVGIALAVKLTSRGPVLFRQTRVGVDGREFTMLKFRSMVAGADRLVEPAERRRATATACSSS